jgi:hypothetical protein
MKRQLLIVGAGIILMLGHTTAAYSARAATAVKKPAGIERAKTLKGTVSDSDTTKAQPVTVQNESVLSSPGTGMRASASANYQIPWLSINSGGGPVASTNYQTNLTVGQAATGTSSSPNYTVGQGFWYGASGGGACACDCHGDPGGCNGVQDIVDVVQTVNVAFRGAASILDPNTNCPYETTDVNCGGSTDVIDVVKMVNVAFRGANVATEFCNPCP